MEFGGAQVDREVSSVEVRERLCVGPLQIRTGKVDVKVVALEQRKIEGSAGCINVKAQAGKQHRGEFGADAVTWAEFATDMGAIVRDPVFVL